MGRVAFHWIRELKKRGYQVVHIGSKEVGLSFHSAFFPIRARLYLERLKLNPDLILVHEPVAGAFISMRDRLMVFSHGIERRNWEQRLHKKHFSEGPISLRTRLLFPLWRLLSCDQGLKKARSLLLINQDDQKFAQVYYRRQIDDILVFRNGVEIVKDPILKNNQNPLTILFNGSWIKRKGIDTLVKAAIALFQNKIKVRWLLVGTGYSAENILQDFPEIMRDEIEVVSSFERKVETQYLERADIFILPSLFEGQPLSLLQAMAHGLPCVTTNICGQKDIIKHGENGILFEAGDGEMLATQLKELIIDSGKRQAIGQRAFLSVQNRSWNEVTRETINWIESRIK